jgi:hypothetical protein
MTRGLRQRIEPPTLGDALNAGYLYLEVRCLGCDTHQTVVICFAISATLAPDNASALKPVVVAKSRKLRLKAKGAGHAGGFLTIILAVAKMKLKAVLATFKYSGPSSAVGRF